MTTWILVWMIVAGYSDQIGTAEFGDEASCRAAAAKLEAFNSTQDRPRPLMVECIPTVFAIGD